MDAGLPLRVSMMPVEVAGGATMTQTRQLRAVLVGLALLAAAITWLLSERAPAERAPVASSTFDHPTLASEAQSVPPQAVTGAVAEARQVPVICPDQSIEVVAHDRSKTSCLSRTRAQQNGSVRTYRVEGQDREGPSLTIDAAGEAILRAELVYSGGTTFSCLRDKCTGISVGPHDAQGARSLRLKGARLSYGEETALVNATLRTVPDDQMAGTSCTGQLLYISIGEGTVHFCPDAGSGFELQEDGSTAYRFMNGDGSTLSVRLGRQGALQSVEYGTFTCRSPNCAGVNVTPAGADERRNFAFQGTVLTEQGAGATTALLNGNLILAPQ